IRKLPEARRNAIYLFYYEGMSIEEIAAATGKSTGTVGSDLYRARKQLRIELED
ncbi:MAG: sigma-70 family RNA polymerase sigma factor, partial [Oscillospiraceae bacterium]|nr:sigma-70 family RNA polymerase sigma factor [Oscillospiraceae bacterium]